MAFSQETKDQAYHRAGGKCECTRSTCSHHTGRCNATLNKWHPDAGRRRGLALRTLRRKPSRPAL